MALQDKIGREEIVNKICGLVDSLQKDQNFCLSINGAWGSGKSFVLQMIEEKLSKTKEYVIVKYDAWENTFYSDPLIAMLYCILDTLQSESSDEIKETISTKRVKKTTTEVAKQVGGAVVETLAENNKIVNFIKNAIVKIQSVIKLYKETALTNNAQTDDYKSYSKFLKETIKQLNEITTQEFYEGKHTKLIVLVDEIDRCLPDEQLKVLERMHHLFDVKNCAVIVAMNQNCIAKSFNRIYDCNGNEYLRKFFDFNYKLEMGHLQFLKYLLIVDLLSKVSKFCKVDNPTYPVNLDIIDKNIFSHCYDLITGYLNNQSKEIDNRRINFYYTSILNVVEKFSYDNLNSYNLFLIVIGLFIEKFIDSDLLIPKLNAQDSVQVQKIYESKFLMNLVHIKTHYNNFYQCYDYDEDNQRYYSMFDQMVRELIVKNDFKLTLNNQEFKGDYKELKQLMLTYGGQDVTE